MKLPTATAFLVCLFGSSVAAFSAIPQKATSPESAFSAPRYDATRLSSTSASAEEPNGATVADASGSPSKQPAGDTTTKVALIVCPAQFCVPKDYEVLFENLKEEMQQSSSSSSSGASSNVEIAQCIVPNLPRTEWIKVAKKLPTQEFLEARLPIQSTLDWYFAAIEDAVAEVFANQGPDVKLCFIGHSIGGWVARSYLGGISGRRTAVHGLAQEQCTSLITLGTPHVSPESALVDQTRGLLREIAESPSCSSQSLQDRGIDVTCVCSSGLGGSFLTTNVEEIVAVTSYLPLLGKIGDDVRGDGIVPLDLAFMEEPSRRVVIKECDDTGLPVRHSHVLPTPWNLWDASAPSISLPDDFVSYVSKGVLSQWAQYIR